MADGSGRHDSKEDALAADGADAAEQAFEALRAEVAGLGRRLDALAQGAGNGAIAPDYSPTLGAMEKELRALGARLDGIEQHPALRMTPASYRAEIETVARAAAAVASLPFVDSLRDAQTVTRQLQTLAARVREQREQQRSLATVAGFGVIGGVLLWFLLVELLPWGAGTWLGARPLGGSRWNAAATLMRDDDPWTWERMVRLYRACSQDRTIDMCEAALAVKAIPPGVPAQPAPEGPKAPAFGTVVSPAHGKVGR